MLFSPHQPERGQGLVEYALILILIAIMLIGALYLITNALSTMFSNVSSAFGP